MDVDIDCNIPNAYESYHINQRLPHIVCDYVAVSASLYRHPFVRIVLSFGHPCKAVKNSSATS